MSILFEDIVFGPIKSRRLGTSLGINVLPTTQKICNFNCVYCECGWNKDESFINPQQQLHTRQEIKQALEKKMKEIKEEGIVLNSLTFAGNGEPTIHPEFSEIVDDVLKLRSQFYPEAEITVLTNSTGLNKTSVFDALLKIDNPILKLDAGSEEMFKSINRLNSSSVDFQKILSCLERFGKRGIIQTLLLRGNHNNETINNFSDKEFTLYLEHLKRINPRYVMLYAIDRETPEQNLEKISVPELESYAEKIRALGIEVKVYG